MELRQDILARRDLINNPSAQRVRRLAGLSRRSFRLKAGLTIIEAPHALREALSLSQTISHIRDIYVAENQIEQHRQLLQLALAKGCYIHPVTATVLDEFTEAAQGIAATFELSFFQDAKLPEQAQLGLALPRTQDPGNLGTIIRTADACGAQYVVVCKGSADPFSPKVIRSSAGSIFHLPIIYSLSLEGFGQLAQAENISLIGTVIHDGKPLPEFLRQLPENKKICWVFGNEAQGLNEQEKQLCQELVSIPLKGQAESFNVASAAVITLYESGQKLC